MGMDMTGLEKIIEQIDRDAHAGASEVLAQADAECARILEAAQAESDRIDAQAAADADALRADILARGESGAQLQRKNRILTTKQDMIGDVIEQAREKLLSLDSIDYFVLLGKLAEKYAQPGDGIMYLSSLDLGRVPAYFRHMLADIAQKKHGTLVLSNEPRSISGGFVLAYGGIEENCSFDAMFEDQKEHLQDVVRAKLFS